MWREQKSCLSPAVGTCVSLLSDQAFWFPSWFTTDRRHHTRQNEIDLWVFYLRKVRTRCKVVGSHKLFTSIFKESSRRDNVNAPRIAGTFFGSTTRCTTATDAANFLPSDWMYFLWNGVIWGINGYCMNANYIFSYVTLNNSVEPFHSCGLQICKVIRTKGRFYKGKRFISQGNG